MTLKATINGANIVIPYINLSNITTVKMNSISGCTYAKFNWYNTLGGSVYDAMNFTFGQDFDPSVRSYPYGGYVFNPNTTTQVTINDIT